MNKRGFDGKKLLETAQDLIAKHARPSEAACRRARRRALRSNRGDLVTVALEGQQSADLRRTRSRTKSGAR